MNNVFSEDFMDSSVLKIIEHGYAINILLILATNSS